MLCCDVHRRPRGAGLAWRRGRRGRGAAGAGAVVAHAAARLRPPRRGAVRRRAHAPRAHTGLRRRGTYSSSVAGSHSYSVFRLVLKFKM